MKQYETNYNDPEPCNEDGIGCAIWFFLIGLLILIGSLAVYNGCTQKSKLNRQEISKES